MKLTVVGCSGSFPGPESCASSYLLEQDGHRVALDLGNGAIGDLARHTSIYDLDAVLITHLHADHFFDLCSLFVARNYHPDESLPRIPVYGPPGIHQRLVSAYGLPPGQGMDTAFDFHEWVDGETVDVGPFSVQVSAVPHPMQNFAMRVRADGSTLTYSGDSAPDDRLVDAARDVDLFLCEAGWQEDYDNPPGIHLTGRQAAEHAVRANAQRLVLTHVPPWNDPAVALAEAGPVFRGDLDVAKPGATYEL
jgi:ribonuclease BN (tRNA processing enzyme)